MHHRIFTRGVIALLVVGVLSLSGLAQAGARQDDPAPRYAVTDLGTIDERYPITGATALNAKGMVVGYAYEPIIYLGRATIYRGGKLRALVKGEKGYSAASDINASGQIVGYALPDLTSVPRATLWDSDEATDLGDLGVRRCYANAINDAGMVVGWSQTTADDGQLPFVWIDGEMTALALLAKGERGTAADINADGLVAGDSTLGPDGGSEPASQHAVVWDAGEVSDLGTIGGDYSGASGINATGQIVGYSTTAANQTFFGPGSHAALWDGDAIVDLGTLADGEVSYAAAINARGEVVGNSTVAPAAVSGEAHAFLWRDGELLDLNDLAEGGSDIVLEHASDINDKGLIVATGLVLGFEHAFLLTPIDA